MQEVSEAQSCNDTVSAREMGQSFHHHQLLTFVTFILLGRRRWADGDYDFGSEPDEEPYAQVWSCDHTFEAFEVPSDETFSYGDLDRMECNRCFERVQPRKPSTRAQILSYAPQRKRAQPRSRGKKIDLKSQKSEEAKTVVDHTALECSSCRLLVCPKCRDKYLAKYGEGRVA